MLSYANDTHSVTAFLKVPRRLIRVALPERVLFACQLLDWRRQLLEAFPSAGPPCRSRQFLKSAGTNVFADFLENRSKPPVFGKIPIDLRVPGGVLTFPDERGKLRQLVRRECFNSVFDVSQAHAGSMPKQNDNFKFAITRVPKHAGGANRLGDCGQSPLPKFIPCVHDGQNTSLSVAAVY